LCVENEVNGGTIMKIWKKNLVATAVLLTVCGGIYGNWLYSQDQAVSDLTDTLDESKIMSADKLVISDGEGAIINESTDTMTDYFAAVRLSRQEARDSAVTLLQETMAYGEDSTTQVSAELEELVNLALCEAQIESLVIAKGYTDCVAYIADNAISLAVASPEGGLQQQDDAVISDIVVNQSEFTMDQIYVVEVK
jgi:stage III sporulation protein AH